MAPSRMVNGGRPRPPTSGNPVTYFFFFLAFFFIERLTSFRVQTLCRPHRIYFFFFLVAFFLATRSPPSAIVQ